MAYGAAPNPAPRYPTGVRVTPQESEKSLIRQMRGTPPTRIADTLPPVVRNTHYLPKVRSQSLQNCGAYGPTYYYKTYQEAREHGWAHPDPDVDPEHVMSPGFTYPLSNKGVDEGANIAYVLSLICRYGTTTWKDMPESSNFFSCPNETQFRAAMPYRGKQASSIDVSTESGIQALKAHLATGDLAAATIHAYYDTFVSYSESGINNDVICQRGSVLWAYHALTIIGYDDTRTYTDDAGPKTGAFFAVNSWGTDWGVTDPDAGTGGFCWLGYDYLRCWAGNPSPGDNSPAIIDIMTDRIDYQPTEMVSLNLSHPVPSYLSVSIKPDLLSDTNHPWLDVFPGAGLGQKFDGTIVADISDFTSTNSWIYWLKFTDGQDPGFPSGFVRQFKVELNHSNSIFQTETVMPFSITNFGDSLLSAGLFRPIQETFWTNGLDDTTAAWSDFDGDGDPDVAVCGWRPDLTNYLSAVYRNDGVLFMPLTNGLPQLGFGAVAWVDFDRDGLPDLALAGSTATSLVFQLVLNNGNGTFSNSNVSISAPGSYVRMAWGDYNNDGAPDLLLAGLSFAKARLFRNLGGTNLVDTGLAFKGSESASNSGNMPVSWADFNNDGWLDCAVGQSLYRNTGTNAFELVAPTLVCGSHGAHAWGDFNGDGRLDLATMNLDVTGSPVLTTTIYRNDAELYYPPVLIPGIFTNPASHELVLTAVATNLPGLFDGSLSWGDVDLDGRLDLLASGALRFDYLAKFTDIIRQLPDGTFTRAGLELPPIAQGNSTLVDVDGDGDLDVFLLGPTDASVSPLPLAAFHENLACNHSPGLGATNTAPSTPSGLSASAPGAGAVRLSWTPATDLHTASPGLSYQVRAGLLPEGGDLLSEAGSLFPPCRFGLIDTNTPGDYEASPQTNGIPGALLNGIPPGRYFWQVRAVNSSGLASDWSSSVNHSIGTAGLRTGDINGDGQVDAADVVLCRRMARNLTTPDPPKADMDASGTVTDNDAEDILRRLLAPDEAGYIPVTRTTIGPSGGVLGAGEFQLTVPSGAWATSPNLELGVSQTERPFGNASPARMYKLGGLPTSISQPLTLRVPDTRGALTNAMPMLFIGKTGPALPDDGLTTQVCFRAIAGTNIGGQIVFTIPASTLHSLSLSGFPEKQPGIAGDVIRSTLDTWIGWDLTEWMVLKQVNGHFAIHYLQPRLVSDREPKRLKMLAISQDFEDAYTYFNSTLGLSRISAQGWATDPFPVFVFDMGTREGDSSPGSINLNYRLQDDLEMRRTTVAHELLHIVQYMYDFTYHGLGTVWLGDATATWAEGYFSTNPAYISMNFQVNRAEAFAGMENVGSTSYYDRSPAFNHGYGMAGMIKHLVDKRGTAVIATIFSNVLAGASTTDALANTLPAPATEWHHEYFVNWLKGGIYPYDTAEPGDFVIRKELTPKSHRFDIKTADDIFARTSKYRHGSFQEDIPGLSARLYRITMDQAVPFTSQDYLAFKLAGSENFRLSVVTESLRPELVDSNSWDATFNPYLKTSRLFLQNLSQLQSDKRSILPLVSNNDKTCPLDKTPMRLDFGLVKFLNGAIPLASHTISQTRPHMEVTGSLTVSSLIGYQTNLVSMEQRLVVLDVWQDGSLLIPSTIAATPLETTWEEPDPSPFYPTNKVTVTITGVNRYILSKTSYPVYGISPTGLGCETNATGQFTLSLGADEEDGALFQVKAECDGVMDWPGGNKQNVLRSQFLLNVLLKRY